MVVSEVAEGGNTVLPNIGVSVKPEKEMAPVLAKPAALGRRAGRVLIVQIFFVN